MTIAKTGIEVTSTAIGKRTFTIFINTWLWFEALKIDKMSEEGSILKLAAPISPTSTYKAMHSPIGYPMDLWMETWRDSSLTNVGTVVIWCATPIQSCSQYRSVMSRTNEKLLNSKPMRPLWLLPMVAISTPKPCRTKMKIQATRIKERTATEASWNFMFWTRLTTESGITMLAVI